MLANLEIFLVSTAAIIGALFLALLGWLESGEPFEARKFTASILRAVLAGIIFASTTFGGVDTILSGWMYVFAFLGGMGIDAAGKRLSGAISVRIKTPAPGLPATPPS